MPRIKGLGELDWNFENFGDFHPLSMDNPAEIRHHHLVGMNLLLITDKIPLSINPMFRGEKALWNYQTRLWQDTRDHKAKPLLPIQIGNLLVKLFEHLRAIEIQYWWNDYRIGIKIVLARGRETGFAPPTFPLGRAIEVHSYARFLDSLANKMSKWWREIEQDKTEIQNLSRPAVKVRKKRYILHISHLIDHKQVNKTREIYRYSDDEAKAELHQIHDNDKTAHEGYVIRENGKKVVGEFCKYV